MVRVDKEKRVNRVVRAERKESGGGEGQGRPAETLGPTAAGRPPSQYSIAGTGGEVTQHFYKTETLQSAINNIVYRKHKFLIKAPRKTFRFKQKILL